MALFRGWNRRRAIRRLERQLGKQLAPDKLIQSMMDGSIDEGPRRLANFLLQDEECSAVLRTAGMDAADIDELYGTLLRHGVGQWVRGRYVPVYVLTNPELLRRAINDVFRSDDPKDDDGKAIAFVLDLEDGKI